jgi:molybdopterin synthase catalytic subunit
MAQTHIRVGAEDFDVGAETERLIRENPSSGAVASFVGVVRNRNDGSDVSAMTLEHYPAMTEKALAGIVAKARERFHVEGVTVIHRVGRLVPGDRIVLVLVASPHRREAFEACEFIMDWLKTEAPFWKKETTPQGERWVEAHDSDEAAKARWSAK